MKAASKRIFIILGLMLGVVLIPSTAIYAQSNDKSDGLEISPALVEVTGAKGKAYTIDVNVRNVTTAPLVFDSVINDFGAKDETGAPSVLVDATDDLTTSIKSWVGTIRPFTLQANEKTTLKVTINIPTNAEPGGHYGVIRFAGRTPDGPATVGQVASAGTLVLISVEGKVNETLELASLDVGKNNSTGWFFENGPLTFTSRFKNTGSVHVKPVGQIEIHDSFGKIVDTIPVNAEKGNVLPDSIRRFESTFDKPWMFGHYSADLSVGYGSTGQALVRTVSFWVIPYKLVGIALILLVTLIYVLRGVIKRYNTYIIKKSRKK